MKLKIVALGLRVAMNPINDAMQGSAPYFRHWDGIIRHHVVHWLLSLAMAPCEIQKPDVFGSVPLVNLGSHELESQHVDTYIETPRLPKCRRDMCEKE
jgi:hypothetical protein